MSRSVAEVTSGIQAVKITEGGAETRPGAKHLVAASAPNAAASTPPAANAAHSHGGAGGGAPPVHTLSDVPTGFVTMQGYPQPNYHPGMVHMMAPDGLLYNPNGGPPHHGESALRPRSLHRLLCDLPLPPCTHPSLLLHRLSCHQSASTFERACNIVVTLSSINQQSRAHPLQRSFLSLSSSPLLFSGVVSRWPAATAAPQGEEQGQAE